MKILVVGGGGREHALVWKFALSPNVKDVLWSPGNPAMTPSPKIRLANTKGEDVHGLADLAQKEGVDLTMVGPEAPLVAGLVDEFQKRKLRVFGPSQAGAQLEASKAFSKRFFVKHDIPTGKAEIFSNFESALKYARQQPKPLVIKADGLAAGKGVIICKTDRDAEIALTQIMKDRVFGSAGNEVLVEECLSGPEVSVHAITDGRSYRLLASAQDHKRVFDHDQGPNTGGMGAYSPADIFTPEIERKVRSEIFDRTIKGLQSDGIPYCGVLYAGLMLTPEGPKILEYNCRLGDPETQVILPRLNNHLDEVLMKACDGRLNEVELDWTPSPSVCVIMASKGYPGEYPKGIPISGLDEAERRSSLCVFHAGTSSQNGRIVTQGGRVLGITSVQPTLSKALEEAYAGVRLIQFEGCHFRTDIAAKAFVK